MHVIVGLSLFIILCYNFNKQEHALDTPLIDQESETNPFLLHEHLLLFFFGGGGGCLVFCYFHRARDFFVPDLEFSTTKFGYIKDVIYLKVV